MSGWMMHAFLTSLAFTAAAVAGERLLRLWRLEARFVWLMASIALTVRFVVAARSLAKRRVGWRPPVVDGERLLVLCDAGPAVRRFPPPDGRHPRVGGRSRRLASRARATS